jgi:hypothetical protein
MDANDVANILLNPMMLYVYLYGAVAVFIAFYIYWFYIRKYGKVYILDEYQNTYFIVKFLRVPLTQHFVTFQKKTYNLDWKNCSYMDGKRPVCFFKLNDALPIKLSNPKEVIVNPENLHKIVKERIIEQLVRASYQPFSLNLMTILFIVLGLIAGFGLGYMCYPYMQPKPAPAGGKV